MINRRNFGSALAAAAACGLAAAVSGCEDAGSGPAPEVKKEQEEARNKSIEYMQSKSAKKKKS
ncbi:hypothetical protein [Planctomyces sp. SH-PL62]|uniref:hypothetical protein n=1 Tax=Planctomyces sp. SH-PL62 TaxID=1636152 RepID=UPI00078CB296|nr:hypothetical protein [Planctomyces sp. SH-PL62]AMV37339.1 hypothetical protein VT85_07890 [Planctomyces sp. SH-PL62]